MKKLLPVLVLVVATLQTAFSQGHGFSYGNVTFKDCDMKLYSRDTTAEAVMLEEFGEAYIDHVELNKIIFQYHAKIKILKTSGTRWADYEIPLRRFTSSEENLMSVKATSYNLSGNQVVPTHLDSRDVITDKVINKKYTVMKIAIPNVKVGSVIEIQYEVHSPALFNFHSWQFQDEIPKVRSEFWASYPANYEYNIVLKGFLKLSKNEVEVIKGCVGSGGGGYTPTAGADCSLFKYAMVNIPAFHEEEYMTAASNFIAGIYYELSIVKYFDGRTRKFTQEWKDVDQDLKKDNDFGQQIRKGKDVVEASVLPLVAGELDEMVKAKKVYEFIQRSMMWNDRYGKYTDLGVKKAFETRKGNIGDINLLLVSALEVAGLDVDPVILSTRDNGFPVELHPVLEDFNYVIAQVNIQGKSYFLDATDPYYLFGMLPQHCINGKGRAMAKQSYWVDLNATHKDRQISTINLKLDGDGMLRGKISRSYSGYEGVRRRRMIMASNNQTDYIEDQKKKYKDSDVANYEIKDLEDFEKPLVESFDIEMKLFESMDASHLLFSPFLFGRVESNPFKSNERLYPIDFGAPIDRTIVFTLDYPESRTITELPGRVAIALPNSGGKYLMDVQAAANRVSVSTSLVITRTIYSSNEYRYIRELYNQMVASQRADLVMEKK